jgi:hypothetical protein
MSVSTLPEAERSRPEALIAEARAHARRRRLKLAVALVLLVGLAAAAVLIGRVVSGTRATARPRQAVLAAGTGTVTGHLAACFGILPRTGALPVTPGTVVALRGRMTEKRAGPDSWIYMFPKGPAAASEHISDNYDQTFRFALAPGHYVIAGRYDYDPPGYYGTFSQVTVTAGATIRVDLPNLCK